MNLGFPMGSSHLQSLLDGGTTGIQSWGLEGCGSSLGSVLWHSSLDSLSPLCGLLSPWVSEAMGLPCQPERPPPPVVGRCC